MSDAALEVDNATKTDPDKVRDPEVKLEHLAQLKRELLEELGQIHAKDNEEKAALREQVNKLQEYIDEMEKARIQRDKVQPDDTTIVLPPNDIPIQQPNVDNKEQVPAGNGGETAAQRKQRMKWW